MNGLRNSLRADSDSRMCILKQNSVAHKLLLGRNGVSKGDEQKVLRLGLLAKIMPYQLGSGDVAVQSILENVSSIPDDIWVVKRLEILPVISALVQALQNLSPCDRVQLVQNERLCSELAKIQVGSKVFVNPEKDDPFNLELATVKYIGPLHNLGPAFFYGIALEPGSKVAGNNGSFYGSHYFECPEQPGIFVTINQLHPCVEANKPTREDSEILMPSHKESGNFKSTLVLHLKEKENMSRSQPSKVERTEKLIDLELPFDCPLRLKDRVVWVSDETGAEPGTVRWIGCLEGHQPMEVHVGVEFDNPVGSSTGMFNGKWLFKTQARHAAFLPISGLLKFEDFYGKPASHQNKVKNPKLSETSKNSKGSLQTSLLPTQLTSSRRRNQNSEPGLWSAAMVDLSDMCDKTDNVSVKSRLTGNGEEKICRSEYVFSEPLPNLSTGIVKENVDNLTKRTPKDSHKTMSSKVESTLSNYLISEASPRELNDLVNNQRRRTNTESSKCSKSSESKSKHGHSKENYLNNSLDLSDFVENMWDIPSANDNQHRTRPKDKSRLSGVLSEQPTKTNNNNLLGLEVMGMGLKSATLSKASKSKDHPETLASPHHSDNGSSEYDNSYPVLDFTSPESPVDLGVGSVVEVSVRGEPRYGVIRWIGVVPEDPKGRKVAGIEMEQELVDCNDGTFNGRRYFQCNPKRALFIGLRHCQKDGRFQDVQPSTSMNKSKKFGSDDSPVIPGAVRPLCASKKVDLDTMCGKYRGIQGRHNSCYLDATLFSMFAFTSVFDSLLFRPRTKADHSHYEEVQRVLREEIVNPLRKNLFVRGDRVMKLRTLLENLSSVSGLTSEEKDPEEFLTSLVAQILRAKPFLKLSSGQEAYHYQLFVEKDEHLRLPTVQQLFEQSFLASDIKLKEVPSCLIIQMPRFGKSFKMYPRICPSQLLDVTDIIEDSPRQCTVCGKLAEFECKECFGNSGIGSGLESIAFCGSCLDTAHNHHRRSSHRYRRLTVPPEYAMLQDHCAIPRLYMELFAVVCIETSHYVTFVKCGSGADSPWCFFDSMADRKGEQNGYNIPEVVSCPSLPHWLSEEGAQTLGEVTDERQLPEHAKRLYCDAYMCMYQSTDMMMYR